MRSSSALAAGAITLAASLYLSGCGAHGAGSTLPSPAGGTDRLSAVHRNAAVALHVLTWDALGAPTGSLVSPSVAAPWLNYALVGGSLAAATRAAGIKAALYTDPARQRPGDFAWTSDESTFAHDCAGNRIKVQPNPMTGTELMDVHSAHLAQLWQQYLQRVAGWAGPFDVVFDDTADEMGKVLGVPCGFNQTDWSAATNAMNTSLGASLIYNGLGATTVVNSVPVLSPSIALNPTTIGGMAEECYMGRSSTGYIRNVWWQAMENTELTMTLQNKLFVCHSTDFVDAAQNTQGRIYYYASFLLSYDPLLSIADEEFLTPSALHVMPESQLVATGPVKALPNDISGELMPGGGYGRQFSQCYLGGQSIGACAAFVNPATSTKTPVAFPWPGKYSHTLVVAGEGVLDGGTVSAQGPAPAALVAGQSAIIAIK